MDFSPFTSPGEIGIANGNSRSYVYFPEKYQRTKERVEIPVHYLEEAAQLSETVMDADMENRGFMEEGLRQNCENLLPNPAEIPAKDAIQGYGFLKFKLFNN